METKDLTVDIEFCLKNSEEGGRHSPITSHYRPDWGIGEVDERGIPQLAGGQLELISAEQIAPGGCGVGFIKVIYPEAWRLLQVSDQIGIYEGSRRVGSARITSMNWIHNEEGSQAP